MFAPASLIHVAERHLDHQVVISDCLNPIAAVYDPICAEKLAPDACDAMMNRAGFAGG